MGEFLHVLKKFKSLEKCNVWLDNVGGDITFKELKIIKGEIYIMFLTTRSRIKNNTYL